VDRVVSLVDGSARTVGQAPFDPVFAEFLARPQEFPAGHRHTVFISISGICQ
jgi:hypothetical protein